MSSHLITAKDAFQRMGYTTVTDGIMQFSASQYRAGIIAMPWSGVTSGSVVLARADFGRWIADCPYCGGAEYVDPDEPIFFCCSCGMELNSGEARPVEFPADREEIEDLLVLRPLDESRGGNIFAKALMSIPDYPGLGRSWLPGETVEDLETQNTVIGA